MKNGGKNKSAAFIILFSVNEYVDIKTCKLRVRVWAFILKLQCILLCLCSKWFTLQINDLPYKSAEMVHVAFPDERYNKHKLTVRLCLSVSCVSPPLVPIFGQFLFLSSFVIISSQPCVFSWLVPSPVSLIILFVPSFPSLYKSSVFPVSLSSINVIPGVCTCLQRSMFCVQIKVFKRSSKPPRSWHPRAQPWQNTGPKTTHPLPPR